MNDSFILYTSYYALIEGLTDEQLGQLTRAIFLYARDGKSIELEPVVRMAFAFIKDNIERNQDKYQAKCEKNRQIALERERKKREAREKADNTNVHERSRTCENNTNVHERSPYDNDNEYDNDVSKETDILEPSKEASMQSFSEKNVCAASEPQKSSEKKKSKKGEIDYAAIKDYWNEQHDKTNSAMRRLTLMTDNRKEAIRGRLKDCKGDISKIYLAIDKAMASSYLNAGHSWASYDWVMTRKYFPKVLEGNYDNTEPAAAKPQDPSATARPSIGELYEQAKHQQPAPQQSQDDKFRWVIQQNLEDLKKNPNNKPAKDSLTRYYERGVLQRLGIDWKPEK
ncbi:DUF6291 domain-containing protein [Prevotella sp.]|uniref:DUF6291 domain-containing protein n=1 Tax=Prevotella sp. TaxID=59823 RepID=UPI0027E23E5E|nr:DUF6291 domain-containing protein [Prevotella sp.]